MIDVGLVWKVAVAGLLLLAGTALGSWIASAVSLGLERAGLDPQVRRWIVRSVRPIVVVIAVVAALEYLDVDLRTVAAMAGGATLALGLTLHATMSNVATGGLLLTLRPYREGELVECAGQLGVVVEQGAFAVVLERADGVLVTIPNNAAFTAPIKNHTRAGRRRIEVACVVPRGTDLEALRTGLAAGWSGGIDPRILTEPAPSVQVLGIEDGGVRIAARVWVKPADHDAASGAVAERVLAAVRALEGRA
ncbi:MAG: mechanosensitive ion channel domain-containing protein [Myxococcota bacterium]